MLLALNPNWWEDWEFYHSVTFDGENKLIIINESVTEISIKKDVYSNWKEWSTLRDNTKFLSAIRVTGGDPIIGTDQSTGDTYFLINGWRILIGHSCTIDGVIYSEDYASPFVQVEGTQIVTNKVSAIVQTVAPVVGNVIVSGITVPTAIEIREEIDSNSIKLIDIQNTVNNTPSAIDIKNELWNTAMSELIDTSTVGGFIAKKLMSISKFLSLK